MKKRMVCFTFSEQQMGTTSLSRQILTTQIRLELTGVESFLQEFRRFEQI